MVSGFFFTRTRPQRTPQFGLLFLLDSTGDNDSPRFGSTAVLALKSANCSSTQTIQTIPSRWLFGVRFLCFPLPWDSYRYESYSKVSVFSCSMGLDLSFSRSMVTDFFCRARPHSYLRGLGLHLLDYTIRRCQGSTPPASVDSTF